MEALLKPLIRYTNCDRSPWIINHDHLYFVNCDQIISSLEPILVSMKSCTGSDLTNFCLTHRHYLATPSISNYRSFWFFLGTYFFMHLNI
jgi:hypothetical protein